MQIDENRFEKLEKKVDQIWDYLKGSELKPNGAETRISRIEKSFNKIWITIYGILMGLVGAIIFILKYGEQLFK